MAIKVLPVSGAEDELLGAAVALGDRYTKWLGLLSPAAYRKMADDDGLLVAADGGEVLGYALFGLPKRSPHVRLVHLCVAEEHRGRGIAGRLIQAIKDRHSQRLGIRARCRRDYDLSGVWTSLGFVPRGEGVGRGRDREPLETWWLDLGHADLFTEVESDALLVVTVDHGVFEDLRATSAHRDAEESRALEAGWLADLIELACTPQLLRDVRELESESERRHQRSAAAALRQLKPAPEAVTRRHEALLDAALANLPDLQPGEDLERRLQYVSETSCAGLQVLVTRDPLLARLADVAWDVAGVRVVEPSVVTLHADELRQAQVYRPADLMGTEFQTGEVAEGGEGELVAFFEQSGEDSGSAFAERLRSLTTDSMLWRRELLRDGEGRPAALYVWAVDGRTLLVPFLRTASHPLEETLARQLLLMLKRVARERGAQVVRITDPSPSPVARAAARDDGFFEHDRDLAALLADACGTAAEVSAVVQEGAGRLGLRARPLGPDLSAEVAGMAERAWWPAKIIDSQMRAFIVPITPRWSTELFNIPTTLIPRSDVLGISREHVYYRSPGRRGESVPARLLWYVSKSETGGQGQMVIGSSRLEEVVVDGPDSLFSQFEHLGVYGRAEVRAAAEPYGQAMALRFADTEIFPKPVTLNRLNALARDLGLRLALQSLSSISNTLFQAVYEEGHRKT